MPHTATQHTILFDETPTLGELIQALDQLLKDRPTVESDSEIRVFGTLGAVRKVVVTER
jgi:hypothetical protein